jgi:hypothetical protein
VAAVLMVKGAKVLNSGTDCEESLQRKGKGFRPCVRTSFPNLVPQGRLNLAQDASPGLDLKGRPSPAGTAENRPRRNPGQLSAVPAGLSVEIEFSAHTLKPVHKAGKIIWPLGPEARCSFSAACGTSVNSS